MTHWYEPPNGKDYCAHGRHVLGGCVECERERDERFLKWFAVFIGAIALYWVIHIVVAAFR